jgi:hypothetical protein
MTSSAALRAREAIQRVCDLNPNDSDAPGEAVLEVERDALLGIVTRAIEAAIADEHAIPTPERREPCMSEYKHYASAVDLERELYLGEPGMSTIEVFSTDCGVMDFATELLTVDEIRDRAQAEIDEIFAEANAEANVVDCGPRS